jgi:hypothetical protein
MPASWTNGGTQDVELTMKPRERLDERLGHARVAAAPPVIA